MGILTHHRSLALLLRYSSAHRATKSVVAALYGIFLLISVIPVLLTPAMPPGGIGYPGPDARWFTSLLSSAHLMVVNPIAIVLAVVALVPQLREMRPPREPPSDSGPNLSANTGQETAAPDDNGALSARTLAAQAVVFIVVGLSWLWRAPVPFGTSFVSWYLSVGWATFDEVIFAVVQAVLWFIAVRKRVGIRPVDGEASPLLAD